jgi:hypothetical protein
MHALKTPWVTDCSEDAYKVGSSALCVEGDCHGVGAARQDQPVGRRWNGAVERPLLLSRELVSARYAE